MRWLSDQAVDRLQSTLRLPDLTGTRYRAIRHLARGGMGTVWLAEDSVLGRNVALKILELTDESNELASRLLREARVLACLEHPGIVPVHDAGTLADGRAFYCMKYVEGQRLDQYVQGITLLPEQLRLVQRIAEPLAFAHAKGILHRDLKPENIMIGSFGEVLVLDWGVAKMNDTHGGAGTVPPNDGASTQAPLLTGAPKTAHGGIFGTPGYMSPEQARGDGNTLDARTDVFGLGAILAFMLTGNAPGEFSPSAPLRNSSKPIPRPLAAICAKALAPERELRYASVQDMTADIANYLQGRPIDAYPENLLEKAGRLFGRHRVAIVLVAAYLLMRLLFILFSAR